MSLCVLDGAFDSSLMEKRTILKPSQLMGLVTLECSSHIKTYLTVCVMLTILIFSSALS